MGCLAAINLCKNNKTCNKLMRTMEEECKDVQLWTEFSKEEPVCSQKCLQALLDISNNSIGYEWIECDCYTTNSDDYFALRDDGFEQKCLQSKRNVRSFCFHRFSCQGTCCS